MSDLTPKQEAFCLAFLETGNASLSYRRAYDVSPDTKANTVEKRACELLKNGKVAGRVTALRAEAANKATLSKAWILEHLMRQVRITMGDEKVRLTIKPRGKDGKDSAPVTIEVSQRDPAAANKALELLARHLGLFVDKVEHTGKDGSSLIPDERIDKIDIARRIAHLLREVIGDTAAARMGDAAPADQPANDHLTKH
jgi:phage terminase small subunit